MHAALVERWFDRAFNSKAAIYLGKRSYSTYLVHAPIIDALVYLCITRFGFGMSPTVLCALIATPVLTLLASVLLFRYVEAPAIAFGKGLFAAKPLQAQPA